MPSFYALTVPQQLPLTPPEYLPSQHSNNTGELIQYQEDMYHSAPNSANELSRPSTYDQSRAPLYSSQPNLRMRGGNAYDRADRYSQNMSVEPAQVSYQPSNAYREPTTLAPLTGYYEPIGAPLLPPMRIYNQQSFESVDRVSSQDQKQQSRGQQQSKEGKAVGGVSAKLDYEMDRMTDFVADMATRVVQPGTPTAASFRKWVYSVLTSTRLPSATILLSLGYLCKRLTQLQSGGNTFFADADLHKLLTVALILGSKFMDDNTFINRSWSDVSNIRVTDLNRLEMEWLSVFKWDLHRDPNEYDGFTTWQAHWKEYNAQAAARSAKPARLSPLNTSVQRQRSAPHAYSPYPTPSIGSSFAESAGIPRASSYTPTAFSGYDHWTSPLETPCGMQNASMTPDYYGGSGVWGPPEGFPQRSTLQWPTYSQLPTPTYTSTAYMHQWPQNAWTGQDHPHGCGCAYCSRHLAPYMMAPAYGLQPVAG